MPSIRDFSGGVLNQTLQNLDQGAGVLFDCKNVLSSWNGELRKRTGTAWLMALEDYKRIVPFRMPNGDDIVLLLANNSIYGYEFTGEKVLKPYYTYTGASPSFPTSGWTGVKTNGDYTIDMTNTSSEEITDQGRAFNAHTGTGYAGEGAVWSALYRPTTNVEGYIQIQSTSAQLFNSLILRWTNACNGNHPGHYKGWLEPIIQYSDDGLAWTSVKTEMSNPMPTGGAGYYSASHVFSSTTENYIVYKVTNVDHDTPHEYWRIVCSRRIPNNQTYAGETTQLSISSVTYLSNTKTALEIDTSNDFNINDDNIDKIKFAQNNNLMIFTNGSDKPYYIEYSGGTFTYGTYATTLSNTQGNPSCVCFYQNRLWFGGFDAFPTRVWGSGFDNFTDFTIPSPVLATSAISADCVEIKSMIENLWGGNNALYCLSDDGISMIDGQGGFVATNQIEFKLRNREPVNNMTPTYKDDIMIYLGRDKKKVLMTDYDFVVQRFKAQNISENYVDFLLEGIRELHYIPDHDSLIYGLLQNGLWFALLFDVTMQKNALYPFETKGKIWDIQPIKHNDRTRLAMVVQRDGVFMLEEKLFSVDQEIMDFMTTEEQQEYTSKVISSDNCYLDCSIKQFFSEPVNIITNVPYAPDVDVEIIADGQYLGTFKTTSGVPQPLYAWKYNSDIIYTTTTTPTTSSTLYNIDQTVKEDYSIDSVGVNSINVAHDETREINYYGYNYIPSITINPASGFSGVFNRNIENDGTITYITGAGRSVSVYAFAWKQGDNIIYTFSNSPSASDRWIIANHSTNESSTISSVGVSENVFLQDIIISVGATVYNSSFVSIGTVEEVLPVVVISGVSYAGFLVNDKKYYRKSTIDTTQTVTETIIDEYERSSEDDYSASSTSILLDEPANEVIIGYSYDSYAVLKFITPYTERKFPKEIAVNFINTGYLEVGNTFDSLKSVLNNLVESVSISNKRILMNGNYAKTLDKHSFETPYVIVRSDKGLPFIITGMDYKVDMSNYQGGV